MYTKEFYSELEKINREMYDSKIIYESVHPIDIITENVEVLSEAVNAKEKFDKYRKLIMEKILAGVDKFKQITADLIKRNSKIVDGYKKVDLNLVNFDKFECDMPDVRTAINNIQSYRMPQFNAEDTELILNNNSIGYKVGGEAKFPQGTFTEDGQVNKAFFNGTVANSNNGRIRINSSNAARMYSDCLELMTKRQDMCNKIVSQVRSMVGLSQNIINGSIKEVNKTVTTESVLLNNSIFKDEYFDILLEDAITTPDQIHKENDQKENGIDTNTEVVKNKNETERLADAVIRYNEIVYSIQSTIMTSLDQLYKEAGMYCEKVSQLSNKHNK